MKHAGKMQNVKPIIKSSNRPISNRQSEHHARTDMQHEENRKQAATTPETDRLAPSAPCGAQTAAFTPVHFLPQAKVNRLVRPVLVGSL